MDYLSLDIAQRKLRDNFYLLLSAVCPRPVALLSTVSAGGVVNLAPYGQLIPGGSNPPSICFCAMQGRNDELKDTPRNILASGEFVINMCTRDFIGRTNECSRPLGPEESEAEAYDFTLLPSVKVRPPRIEESPLHLECRLHSTLQHGEGPLHSLYIVGEVLMVHLADELLAIDGEVDARKFGFVGKLGADSYCEVDPDSVFDLPRLR